MVYLHFVTLHLVQLRSMHSKILGFSYAAAQLVFAIGIGVTFVVSICIVFPKCVSMCVEQCRRNTMESMVFMIVFVIEEGGLADFTKICPYRFYHVFPIFAPYIELVPTQGYMTLKNENV